MFALISWWISVQQWAPKYFWLVTIALIVSALFAAMFIAWRTDHEKLLGKEVELSRERESPAGPLLVAEYTFEGEENRLRAFVVRNKSKSDIACRVTIRQITANGLKVTFSYEDFVDPERHGLVFASVDPHDTFESADFVSFCERAFPQPANLADAFKPRTMPIFVEYEDPAGKKYASECALSFTRQGLKMSCEFIRRSRLFSSSEAL